jgi:hypothetical protein
MHGPAAAHPGPELFDHMKVRGARRDPGTWLAIQASTKASTSGELRILAHSDGVKNRPRRRTTIGERFTAAMRACKPAEDAKRHAMTLSDPVAARFLMVKLRSIGQAPTAGRGSLASQSIVAADRRPVRIAGRRITGPYDPRATAAAGQSCGIPQERRAISGNCRESGTRSPDPDARQKTSLRRVDASSFVTLPRRGASYSVLLWCSSGR